MSNLIRRMQRMKSRSLRAKKSAIGHRFATQLGVSNPKAKDLLARTARLKGRGSRPPLALRRSRRSLNWLLARAAKRVAATS